MNGSAVSWDKSQASDRHRRVPASGALGISENNFASSDRLSVLLLELPSRLLMRLEVEATNAP